MDLVNVSHWGDAMSRPPRQRSTDCGLSLTGILRRPCRAGTGPRQPVVYMHGLGLPAIQAQHAVLAGYEAMANNVEHAYPPGGAGTFDLQATHGRDGVLTVPVTDHGT